MLHGWDGVLWLASVPLFPPNITMVIMAKQFFFVSSDQRTFLLKVRSMSPCAVANQYFFMAVLEQWLLPW